MGVLARLAVVAGLVVVTSASGAVTGTTRYNATAIPKLPGYNDPNSIYETSDISPNGKYVVGRAYNFLTQQYRAFVYSNGATQFIPGLDNLNSQAFGVNDSGDIVASSYAANGAVTSYLYSGGTLTTLDSLPVQDISNPGLIAEYRRINSAAYGPKPLGYPPGYIDLSVLSGMSESGHYGTGSVHNGTTSSIGLFVFDNQGNTVSASSLGAAIGPGSATAVNNAGHVVGYRPGNSSPERAFLYDGSFATTLGLLGTDNYANAVNNFDDVVGYYFIPNQNPYAFVWSGGAMFDLNSLVNAPTPQRLTKASDINDKGMIAVDGYDAVGGTAFVLTPVPEPALGLLAFVGTLVLRRRRSAVVANRIRRGHKDLKEGKGKIVLNILCNLCLFAIFASLGQPAAACADDVRGGSVT